MQMSTACVVEQKAQQLQRKTFTYKKRCALTVKRPRINTTTASSANLIPPSRRVLHSDMRLEHENGGPALDAVERRSTRRLPPQWQHDHSRGRRRAILPASSDSASITQEINSQIGFHSCLLLNAYGDWHNTKNSTALSSTKKYAQHQITTATAAKTPKRIPPDRLSFKIRSQQQVRRILQRLRYRKREKEQHLVSSVQSRMWQNP
jgi:hypothetical protein